MTFSGTNPNVLDLCRLCLGKDDSLIPVFDCLQSDKILSDKINVCLAIQISADDRISQKICGSCLIKVDSFYEFRNTTSESQKVLERWLQDLDSLLANSNSKEADINHKEVNYNYSIENSSGGEHTDNESETTSYESSSLEDNDTPIQEQQGQNMVEMDLAQTDIINILPSTAPGPSGLQPTDEEALLEEVCSLTRNIYSIETNCDRTQDHGIEINSTKSGGGYVESNCESIEQHGNRIILSLLGNGGGADSNCISLQDEHGNGIKFTLPSNNIGFESNCDNKQDQQGNDLTFDIPGCDDSFESNCDKIQGPDQSDDIVFSILSRGDMEADCRRMLEQELYANGINFTVPAVGEIESNCVNIKEAQGDRIEFTVSGSSDIGNNFENLEENTQLENEVSFNNLGNGGGLLFSSDTIKKYACDFCGYSSNSKTNLQKHVMRHKKEYKFVCKSCGKGFYSRSRYNEHTVDGVCNQNCSLRCSKCNKRYISLARLSEHMKTHEPGFVSHTGHQCESCGKTYQTRRGMMKHIAVVHKGIRHKCMFCDKELTCAKSLEVHMKSHTGEKTVFHCQACGKAYSTFKNLAAHEMLHTGEQPYKCDICHKVFTDKSALLVHKRHHTGEKPYKCSFCEKSFVSKSIMKSHEKTHKT